MSSKVTKLLRSLQEAEERRADYEGSSRLQREALNKVVRDRRRKYQAALGEQEQAKEPTDG